MVKCSHTPTPFPSLTVGHSQALLMLPLHRFPPSDNQVVIMDSNGVAGIDDRLRTVSTRAPLYSLHHLCPFPHWCRLRQLLAGLGGMGCVLREPLL